jgi:hypothetical protein
MTLARIGVTLCNKYVILVYETVFLKISIIYFPNVTIANYSSLFACKDSETRHFATDGQIYCSS